MKFTEQNKAIAEYMGRNWIEYPSYFSPQYHVECDALMEVVEKITTHKFEYGDTAYFRTFGMVSEDGKYMVRINRNGLHKDKSLRMALFSAVAEFCDIQNNRGK